MSSTISQPAGDSLQAGRDAVARHDWREAYDHLSAAAGSAALAPADLLGMGKAAWWTGRLQACIDAFERAYAGFVEGGEGLPAGLVALELARLYMHKLSPAIGAGWFRRAERLLREEPESREHGYLLLALVSRALTSGDLNGAQDLARRAYETGSRSADRDLQALALHSQGYALLLSGEVAAGLDLLDEAAAAAVGGELGPSATALVYCNTISACRDLADYRRAGDWTDAVTRWCERQSIAGFPGVCRIHRAEMMRLRGRWPAAEQEVRRACDELRDFALDVAGEGFHELGEIRLRVGDLAGAAEAFRQAHEMGREPVPGLSLLRLAEGKTEAAASSIRRALAEDSPRVLGTVPFQADRLSRARLLPAQVEIALAAGDLETARSAVTELEAIGETYGTPALEAMALQARGALQLAERAPGAARQSLRRACQLWRGVDAPYEAARTRMLLGECDLAEGESESAARELEAARSVFERLGAVPDERRAAELLERTGEASVAQAPPTGRRAVRTFMFTDIEKSTNLVELIGDDAWEDLLRWHDQTLRGLLAAHGGEEINRTGDGFFVGFRTPADAVDCAVAIQRRLAEHRRSHGFAPQVRIGLHAAEAARLGRDFGGKGVHEAARIAALAAGGEIVASRETVTDLPIRFPASEPRAVALRGMSDPVQIVTIDWR